MESRFPKPFLVRLGVYGGCLLSVGLVVWQQEALRWAKRLAASQESATVGAVSGPIRDESSLRHALIRQVQVYEETGTFAEIAIPEEAAGSDDVSPLVVWTAPASDGRIEGPQQLLNGQMFPPSRDHSILLTFDGKDQHFIAIAYAVDEATARAHLCHGDRPFQPTEIQLVEAPSEDGTETVLSVQCPINATGETIDS